MIARLEDWMIEQLNGWKFEWLSEWMIEWLKEKHLLTSKPVNRVLKIALRFYRHACSIHISVDSRNILIKLIIVYVVLFSLRWTERWYMVDTECKIFILNKWKENN